MGHLFKVLTEYVFLCNRHKIFIQNLWQVLHTCKWCKGICQRGSSTVSMACSNGGVASPLWVSFSLDSTLPLILGSKRKGLLPIWLCLCDCKGRKKWLAMVLKTSAETQCTSLLLTFHRANILMVQSVCTMITCGFMYPYRSDIK